MKVFIFEDINILPAVGIIMPRHDGELSRLDFGKPEGSLGCYLNYECQDLVPCTERQRELIEERGLKVPDGLTRREANYIIDRAKGRDSLESPDWQLVELANAMHIKMSAYIGSKELLRSIIHGSGLVNQAAFYCYAVKQSIIGEPLGNMMEDPGREAFYEFANIVENDQSLVRSLDGRQDSEYTVPKTSVKIYKAAVEHLKANGLI